ncbi:hypothetical protein [Sphingobacterium griseoflavum]|uniref:Uncharacterized protein n=1 Tax=Sphingobacterium griseoflavum TaxID=1474952 RepID=A0ABQ3HUK2_9SPHI|nr:hypothetical protein [Sphingobacterium griseoflavum]GHE28581.1 hypothetical protein GCM10017764_08830 [Sphingobacterium griseoflavum]
MQKNIDSRELIVAGKSSRFSWGAILCGVIMAVVIQLLLTLLGVGIGLVNFSPTSDASPFSGFGTGVTLWWVISMLLSLFAGGWIGGWLNTAVNKMDNMLHGAVVWAVFSLFSFYFVTASLTSIMNSMGQLLGKTLNATGSVIKDVAPDVKDVVGNHLGLDADSFKSLKEEVKLVLRQTDKEELQPENLEGTLEEGQDRMEGAGRKIAADPTQTGEEIQAVVDRLFNLKEGVLSEADQDALANVVAARSGKSKVESRQIVENWVEAAEDVKERLRAAGEKAEEVGEQMSDAVGRGAIWAFFALLFGAGCAILGAFLANKRKVNEAKSPYA